MYKNSSGVCCWRSGGLYFVSENGHNVEFYKNAYCQGGHSIPNSTCNEGETINLEKLLDFATS